MQQIPFKVTLPTLRTIWRGKKNFLGRKKYFFSEAASVFRIGKIKGWKSVRINEKYIKTKKETLITRISFFEVSSGVEPLYTVLQTVT